MRLVTMNRPAELNAFTIDMHVAFAKLWGVLEDDTQARAVVLTGAGRAFSAGGDLDDFEARRVDFEVRRRAMGEARWLVTDLLDVRIPVIAAVNGPAVGLGCTLAPVRSAGDEARAEPAPPTSSPRLAGARTRRGESSP